MPPFPKHPPPPATLPAERLLSLATGGYAVANAISAAAELDLASALTGGPRSAQEIASQLGLDADAVRRLLRALSGAGVFEQLYDGRFGLTELSRAMVDGQPGSMRALLQGGDARWRQDLWAGLVEMVRTGEAPAARALGSSVREYLSAHPEEGTAFEVQRVALAGRLAVAALDAYRLGGVKVMVEVGEGGPAEGCLLAEALARHPEIRCTRVDLPEDQVPPGADVYALVNVLRDCDDARAGEIVRACRQVMGPESRLLVLEMVLPEIASVPHLGLLEDVEQMVLFGGARERSEREYREILEREGLQLVRVVPTATSSSVLEAALQRPVQAEGDQDDQGGQGDQGDQGDRGDRGDQGDQGGQRV